MLKTCFFFVQSKIIWTRPSYFGIFQIYRRPIETQGILVLFWVNETFLNLPLWILVTFTCLAEKFPACTISVVLDMKVEWRCFYYPSRGLHSSVFIIQTDRFQSFPIGLLSVEFFEILMIVFCTDVSVVYREYHLPI